MADFSIQILRKGVYMMTMTLCFVGRDATSECMPHSKCRILKLASKSPYGLGGSRKMNARSLTIIIKGLDSVQIADETRLDHPESQQGFSAERLS
jgi:hypothetical protein